MSHEVIKRMYETKLKEFADTQTPKLPISYFNVKFSPVPESTYLRSHLTPVLTETLTLSGDHKMFIGIYQIAIIVKMNTGTSLASNIAAGLSDVFKVNAITEDVSGLKVQQITPLQVSKGYIDDTVFILPTSFNYRCDTN